MSLCRSGVILGCLLPSGLEGVDRNIDSEALPDETREMGLSAANVPTACDYPGEMMRHGHTILPNILHGVSFTDEDKEYLATTTAWESILNEYTVESRYTDQPARQGLAPRRTPQAGQAACAWDSVDL